MKISYSHLHSFLLVTLLISTFFIVSSCSDDSSDPEEDSNTPVMKLYQPSSSLDPNDKCYAGWDIHPYKTCSKPSFGIKTYKEEQSQACGVQERKIKCLRCKHQIFGLDTKIIRDDILEKEEQGIIDWDQELNKIMKELNPNYPAERFIIKIFKKQRMITKYLQGQTRTVTKFKYHLLIWEVFGYQEGEDCNVCGFNEEVTYNSCRDPSHGVEEYITKPSKECGIDESVIVRSINTMSRQDVKDFEGEIVGCRTCDDISFDSSNMDETNQKNLVTKINCLLNNLDRTPIDDPISSLIRSELRQLFNYSDLINNIDPNLFNRMKERI